MNSIWSGSIEGAFFDVEKFDKYRDIQLAENEASKKNSDKAYYVLGVDVGRIGFIKVGSIKISLIAGTSFLVKIISSQGRISVKVQRLVERRRPQAIGGRNGRYMFSTYKDIV